MTQKKSDDEPNIMTVLMKEAADVRGFKNFYQKQGNNTVIWVCFSINNVDYYYARGRLLEAGKNKWGDFGRNINDKAQILIADKFGTKNYLKELGFNVPEGCFFRRRHIDEAIKAFDSFTKPLCVKPNSGSEGRNVFPALYTRYWYEHAIRHVAQIKPNIVVEESVAGEHFRFFIFTRMLLE